MSCEQTGRSGFFGLLAKVTSFSHSNGGPQSMHEHVCRPYGTRSVPLYPGLPPWARIFRAFGAGAEQNLWHLIPPQSSCRANSKNALPTRCETMHA